MYDVCADVCGRTDGRTCGRAGGLTVVLGVDGLRAWSTLSEHLYKFSERYKSLAGGGCLTVAAATFEWARVVEGGGERIEMAPGMCVNA